MSEGAFADDDCPLGISDVEVAAVEGGIVVLEESSRALHQLDGIAGSVWLLCDGATRVGSMPEILGGLAGVPAADIVADVHRTLAELAAAGLIDGVVVQRVVTVPDQELFAPDGSQVVLPRRDACGPGADTSVWAGSITLRVGADRDKLVSIRGDSPETLTRLRTLFADWVEPAPPDVGEHPAAFSVWLTPPELQEGRRRGSPGTMPQLRTGSTVMARSRRPDDMLLALALAVGGVHAQLHADPRTWVGLRVFASGDVAALADFDRPEMVNDPWLAARGVHELATWETVVGPDGTVSVPPSMPGLAWPSAGVDAPAETWRRYGLAGIVSMRPRERGRAELVAKLVKYRVDAGWFRIVTSLAADSVVHVTDHGAARREISRLLG